MSENTNIFGSSFVLFTNTLLPCMSWFSILFSLFPLAPFSFSPYFLLLILSLSLYPSPTHTTFFCSHYKCQFSSSPDQICPLSIHGKPAYPNTKEHTAFSEQYSPCSVPTVWCMWQSICLKVLGYSPTLCGHWREKVQHSIIRRLHLYTKSQEIPIDDVMYVNFSNSTNPRGSSVAWV